jgi:hypothetical protein
VVSVAKAETGGAFFCQLGSGTEIPGKSEILQRQQDDPVSEQVTTITF